MSRSLRSFRGKITIKEQEYIVTVVATAIHIGGSLYIARTFSRRTPHASAALRLLRAPVTTALNIFYIFASATALDWPPAAAGVALQLDCVSACTVPSVAARRCCI